MRLRVDDDGVFHFEGGGDVAAATGPGESVTARVRSTLTVASVTALVAARVTLEWQVRLDHGSGWQQDRAVGADDLGRQEQGGLRQPGRTLRTLSREI
jgi:hypothetical protein